MILDIIVVLIVAFGFYTGYSRGLIKTVFDTLSLFIGILAVMILSPITIEFLEGMFNISRSISYLVGIVITFLLVMALVRFVGRKIEDVLEAANINFLNKLAGGALQGVFFAFIISMVLWVLGNYNVVRPETKANSVTYPLLEPLPEAGKSVFEAAKPIFKSFWDKTTDVMESIGDAANKNSEEVNG
ncbi:MAG: CvpA family protein [Saprospiraceae bacterium]|nr:CvpA family protein [Saprospiraceae bacterium]